MTSADMRKRAELLKREYVGAFSWQLGRLLFNVWTVGAIIVGRLDELTAAIERGKRD